MKLILLAAILTSIAVLALGAVLALYHHKKASSEDLELIGETARVEIQLDPEGTVLVCGELWRAKSNDGALILARARVRVVGFQDHLVLVEVCD